MGNVVMRTAARLGASLLVFLLLFQLLVPLQMFGLSQSLLHYPAEGETQASENFQRIFLFIVPALAVLSSFVPGLVLAALRLTPMAQRKLGVACAASTLSLAAVVVIAELMPAGILLLVSLEALFVFGAMSWLRSVRRQPPKGV